MAKLMLHLLQRLDGDGCEVCFGSRTDPKSGLTFYYAEFQMPDDQRRLFDAIHIQFRPETRSDDFDIRPLSGDKIGIRFVDTRAFFSQSEPGELGMRTILS
jgi:hypothetical protein